VSNRSRGRGPGSSSCRRWRRLCVARCLVVGGNGFIGSHVVDALARRGHRVSAFDRFGAIGASFDSLGVRRITGDFLSRSDLSKAVAGHEIVVHCLSTTSPATADDEPSLDITTNVAQSVQLLQVCVEAGVRRVAYASSGGAIYGDQPKRVFSETDLALPTSPYAIGKLAVEGYLRYFRKKFGLDYVVFRISNPYGPRQHPQKRQGVIPISLRRIAEGEPVVVYGDGSMVRDYLYVEDLAAMMARMVDAQTNYDVYNIGSGVGTSVNELLEVIRTVVRRPFAVVHEDVPPTFVDHVTLDVARIAEEFGDVATTDLETGIRSTWADSERHRQ
jgi:UDP-glucose 4-epimerase